ncbi:MAG: SagB/ThcOx family dehydrogenase [Thaumarchaeota archaeon]|nr:SagB/ThcOx family dehydrogenase [Nitrososphaerota archaeon]
MKNYDVECTWHYHNGTKHPNGTLLSRSHTYHPALRPTPYKIYKNIQKISLSLDKEPIGISALDAISNIYDSKVEIIPDLNVLTRILYFSGGITKKIKFPPPIGEFEFRAASCTGALYHIEIYVVCSDITGLSAGVYHFDPKELKLNVLRKGDFRQVLVNATADEEFVKQAPVTLIFTDVFSRNSIKYQAREYRHAFWDCGTIIANTLSIISAHKISSRLISGFVDSQINNLLDLDSNKEASLVTLSIGCTNKPIPQSPTLVPINIESASSDSDVDYPEINSMHDASSLCDTIEVKSWRKHFVKPQYAATDLISLRTETLTRDTIEKVILRRGSTRAFSHDSINFEELSTILKRSTNGIDADFLCRNNILNDLYLIVNKVDGLPSGSYHYARERDSLQLLRKGDFRETSGNLGLDQDLPHDASVTIFLMVNLQKVLESFGNRGYRIAQLDAAITGGRMYLAAYALNLGATGLTFYDDLVTNFFSPHAKNKDTMFMIALGKKAKSS